MVLKTNKKIIKKGGVVLFVSICVILLLINSQTPFFQPQSGPWSIGYGKSSEFPESVLNEFHIYTYKEMKLLIENTSFISDPFFIKEKDTFYLFFEHRYMRPNAEIALMTSCDGINYEFKGTVLKENFHLSYPLVFKHENEFYLLPETKKAGNILLYKSYDFPYDWRVHDTLVKNVRLKDPTIFLSDTLNILVASDDELNMFMYRSDSLFGEWKLHKRPKVMMGKEARPGGRFFIKDKKLHLPVQNATFGYGYGISLYEFRFDNDTYTPIRKAPFFMKAQDSLPFFNAGMHHLDIQKIDNDYHYVFDGNQLKTKEKTLNYKGPFKWSYINLKNWIYQKLN